MGIYKKICRARRQLVKTAWLVIGATLLLILFLEVACGLIYHLLPVKTGSFYFPHSQDILEGAYSGKLFTIIAYLLI
ncbi:MAG: hypothetical protein HY790_06190 [Deltaproteobacteria bacterium]|nr:hypothetical protein [Deltaproteobacteria bacterium]MBI4795416.1 hypothetical protein [Deltaproteobacteria bacterium]